jgi:orotidine-5'-phosphate decarboxylase
VTFGARLRAGLDAHGPLCVGIDPHATLLAEWGLPATAGGARDFGLRVVEAAAGRVAVVKPQVAFYEKYGSAGFAALEDVLAAARAAGLLVIADAKRGDIGSTMAGYADAWLAPGSPLEADAVTLSPYLGPESLHETLGIALRHDKGAFVLAATSNPDATIVQQAQVAGAAGGRPVAERIARDIGALNVDSPDGGSLGSLGLVIGATIDRTAFGLDDDVLAWTPILAPGFGAQGGDPADLGRLFGAVAQNVIASESRSILAAGPNDLAGRIAQRAALYGGAQK